MRSSFLPIIVGLLAISDALTINKRQTEYIRDGSFEAIPSRSLYVDNARAGGWRLKDGATFNSNRAGSGIRYETPFGTQFLGVGQRNTLTHGSAAQDLTGLTSGTYTLSYYYKNTIPFVRDCTMNSTYGTQLLDTILLPADAPFPPPLNWTARSISFVPEQPDGTLKFTVDCGQGRKRGVWAFYFDNFSVVGPA